MMLNKNYNNLFCENFMMSLIYKKERTKVKDEREQRYSYFTFWAVMKAGGLAL